MKCLFCIYYTYSVILNLQTPSFIELVFRGGFVNDWQLRDSYRLGIVNIIHVLSILKIQNEYSQLRTIQK